MTHYGLFNDEGLVEGDFASLGEAEAALKSRYTADDDLHVAAQCHEHPEEEADFCASCLDEEDEIGEEEEEDDEEC